MTSAAAGHGRLAPRRPARPAAVPHLAADRPLALDGGGRLRDVTIAYETWGTLDADASQRRPRLPRLDRRQPRRRPDRARPPDAGLVGGRGRARAGRSTPTATSSCAPTCSAAARARTGPASIDPDDGRPYGSRFPVVTIRDMVRAQAALADHLGVARVAVASIGGSMGGMQVLEWAHHVPGPRPLAHPDRHVHAGHRAADRVGRDRPAGHPPRPGLAGRRLLRRRARRRARTRAWPSPAWSPRSRSAPTTCSPTGSAASSPTATPTTFELWQRFEVERYLDHHGDKLVRRFDANSYLVLGKAMDLHDVGRGPGRPGARRMARIRCPTLVDRHLERHALPGVPAAADPASCSPAPARPAEYVEIDSPHGHDAFLIDLDQVGDAVAAFLDEVES